MARKPGSSGGTPSRSKRIVLFSDGTGNSSGKLFKTNVWRLYEAVDLGIVPGKSPQVAYYDNGVGTSSIRLLAILTGIFGFGLKRNLLELYRYLCRNYEPGDQIFAFGFSRGAFTIRLLVAFVAERGIVRYETEAELIARSLDEYRAFSRANNPDVVKAPAKLARLLRDGWIWLKRRIAGQVYPNRGMHRPDIDFVGVWDTVAAYGGPFAEVTRGINNWIWPLTPSNYYLHRKVRAARHALALDDERDSFQPLLWDEFKEMLRVHWAENCARRLREKAAVKRTGALAARRLRQAECFDQRAEFYRTRLQQVWFAGMHADVGGGYPDESLSYVSLLWMMDEAKQAGLRLLADHEKWVSDLSNSLGPIHNSRSGLASYYRYQPRKIAAYMHPVSAPRDASARAASRLVRETLSLRDPTLGEKDYRPQGYLTSCKVHESVAARITSGTDDYAPIGLPDGFELVHSPRFGAPLYDAAKWRNVDAAGTIPPGATISPRADRQEAIWDWVFWRRLAYFVTVLLSLALALFPWWRPDMLRGAGGLFEGLNAALSRLAVELSGGLLRGFAPGFVQPWVAAWLESTLLFLILVAAILIAMGLGGSFERTIRDRTRKLWCDAMAGPLTPDDAGARTWLRRRRNSYGYQRAVQILKWRLLPNAAGLALTFLILWGAAALLAQMRLAYAESRYCPPHARGVEEVGTGVRFQFRTWEPCNPTGVRVRKGHRYALRLRVPEGAEWKDGGIATDPRGLPASRIGPLGSFGTLGIPFRRMLSARYLQPIYHIRTETGGVLPPVRLGKLNLTPHQLRRPDGAQLYYWGEFVAPANGELFLFANEGVMPFDVCFFYAHRRYGNRGTATVELLDLGTDGVDLRPWERRRTAIRTVTPAQSPDAIDCADPGERRP